MINRNFIIFIFFVLILVSCSSKKNILMLQDIKIDELYESSYETYRLKIDDILKIDVASKNPELALEFAPNFSSNFNSKDVLVFNGYQINKNGTIYFPTLGEIKAVNLTILELRKNINDLIIDNGYLIDAVVDIKILNSSFTIIGEVKNPGRYSFLKNNLNIFEAIGMAGDLTINGVRSDIKIIREVNNKKIVNSVDLTKSNLLLNEYYQIFSGDIIVVNPNPTKIKTAGVIGNSGTLLNLLSFITTLVVLLSN